MFGLKLMRKRTFEKKQEDARNRGLWDLVELLRTKKNNIYLDQVTLVGDHQTLNDNLIMVNPNSRDGCGVLVTGTIVPPEGLEVR